MTFFWFWHWNFPSWFYLFILLQGAQVAPPGGRQRNFSSVPHAADWRLMFYWQISGSSMMMETISDRGTRTRRYAINPLGHKWTHHNITYRWVRPETPEQVSRKQTVSLLKEAELQAAFQAMLRAEQARWPAASSSSRIIKFPNTLNKEDTRKAISIAFTKWSDVSPLTFTEVTNGSATADITIGTSQRKDPNKLPRLL